MAYTKIKPIYQTINKAIKYITNENKTRDKELIFTNFCSIDNTSKDFYYLRNTFNKKLKVKARHIIQSFEIGETTPGTAFEIAKEFMNENFADYQYVISTHIDKNHVHNHIIFNPINLKTGFSYNSNKKSFNEKIVKKFNKLCINYGLSNAENKKQTEKRKSIFSKPKSIRDKVRIEIDKLIKISKTYDEFIDNLRSSGFEIKDKKFLSVKKSSERFIRTSSIDKNYSKEKILKRIFLQENYSNLSIDKSKTSEKFRKEKIIDFSKNLKAQKIASYNKFARKHNFKIISDDKLKIVQKYRIDSFNNTIENIRDKISKLDKNLDDLIKIYFESSSDKQKILIERKINILAKEINDLKRISKNLKVDQSNNMTLY